MAVGLASLPFSLACFARLQGSAMRKSDRSTTPGIEAYASGHNIGLGRNGELLVARHYQRRGFRLLAHSWRCRAGELDLVLQSDQVIVFCEVKTRSTRNFGWGAEAVDQRKQDRIRRLAAIWLAEWDGYVTSPIRFDVAVVEGSKVEVLENAW